MQPDLTNPAPTIRWVPRAHLVRVVVFVAVVVAVYVHAWGDTDIAPAELVSGFRNLTRIVGEMFPPDGSVLSASIRAGIVTFDTALLGTTLAFVISLLLTPLAARNITPHRVL